MMRVPNALQMGVVSALCLGGIALGSALHLPATAAQVYQQYLSPDTTCTSGSPCTTTTNNGSGPASANTSLGGTALTGTTKFNGTSKTKFAAGVLGIDSSTRGMFDVGVEGKSVSGSGVLGTSKSGSGVTGTSSNTGVLGNGSTVGVEGTGNVVGVAGKANDTATNAVGIFAIANGTGGVGLLANGASIGVQAEGPTAIRAQGGTSAADSAVEADSSGSFLYRGFSSGKLTFDVDSAGDVETVGEVGAGNGVFLSTENAIAATTTDPTSSDAVINSESLGAPLFSGRSNTGGQFLVDGGGNITITGEIHTAGSCSSGCIAHGPGQKRVVSYASRESQPTIEDFGEGQLVDGQARIALDPAFANVIDQNANYFVFMTPDGDCNGLFIAGKTGAGFTVRELRGGHSTLGFEYRIVAKPFGDHSSRLPIITLRPQPMPNVTRVMPTLKPAQRGDH